MVGVVGVAVLGVWVLVAVSSVGTHAGPLAVTLTLAVLFSALGSLTDDGALIDVTEVTSVDPHRKFGLDVKTTVRDAPEGNFSTTPFQRLTKLEVVESLTKVGHVVPPVGVHD